MNKIYLYLLITMIVLPFCGRANQIYGVEATTSPQNSVYTASLSISRVPSTQQEPDKPVVRLYPNPNEGAFTLEITDDRWQMATATLHNIIGLEIDRRTVLLGENSYSIPECQPGIYFLTLQQDGLQKVLRFVKR
ncbi:T9SS type A sorting domain-containing protein [Tunicatimonas pelagia]|uniref:T9SS type A sorting domain-containing protein n=1 Tax=Tunicatimonas pelagia TaxID=931531 RepID=UPI0026650DE4|nr:T9SS type A sorting domain-containing protein [Tunicatimonas pelagia]WKN43909.1 T9SS type A sorting domain-containing protein [Tunicatimonas pelagia]